MRAILCSLFFMAVAGSVWLFVEEQHGDGEQVLLNVSYDPTRELWRELNEQFRKHYFETTGKNLIIRVSHGGSSAQAGAVFSGLRADVVTLALWSDVDMLRQHDLIKPDWEKRLPPPNTPNVGKMWAGRSVAYYSTIVFVVRKGNPRGIHDWPDLVQPGVQVITPNPKTSGNGRLSFLAAWGAALRRAQFLTQDPEEYARDYVTKLYRNVPVLDSGARGSTTTFAQNQIGDVHLAWENEAHLEVREFPGKLELVYPSCSIRAEPPVAVVDKNVKRNGTRAAAEAYLEYLYTRPAQEIVAKNYYRPVDDEVLRRHADVFKQTTQLFAVTELFPEADSAHAWELVQEKFFSRGGVFETIWEQDR